ncbi:hypothetical protein OSTOST_18444 [Ostertagia ostertagi]
MFSLSKQHELRREATCVEIGGKLRPGVYNAELIDCTDKNVIEFEHTESWTIQGGVLRHKERGLCLDVEGVESGGDVLFTRCDETKRQKWRFDRYFELV